VSCKAARGRGNSKNEANDHVVVLRDLTDGERKDKVAEIAEL